MGRIFEVLHTFLLEVSMFLLGRNNQAQPSLMGGGRDVRAPYMTHQELHRIVAAVASQRLGIHEVLLHLTPCTRISQADRDVV